MGPLGGLDGVGGVVTVGWAVSSPPPCERVVLDSKSSFSP
jgi:hypothetical protein